MDWNNKQAVLEAVKQDGRALEFASDGLKNDKEIVLESIQQDGKNIAYASNELRADKELALTAVQQNICALVDIDAKFLNDKEIVLEAVKQDGYLLRYASDNLKNDKEVVLAAINSKGSLASWGFRFASPAMRDDIEVVRTAIQKDSFSMKFASERIQRNPSLLEGRKPSLLEQLSQAAAKLHTKSPVPDKSKSIGKDQER